MQSQNALGRKLFALCLLSLLLAGCTGIPEAVRRVTGFQMDHYLRTWYEIARLDHTFAGGSAGKSPKGWLRHGCTDLPRSRGALTGPRGLHPQPTTDTCSTDVGEIA